ncbi:MAG: hypothetical protein K8R73_13900 [Clostridiales bacterium]|nr:hypothetical protein [Clostridiales bacterium]
MLKSKELNITTSEIKLEVNKRTTTPPKIHKQKHGGKWKCRNGILGVSGGSIQNLNFKNMEEKMTENNWKVPEWELGPLETREIETLEKLGVDRVDIHKMNIYRFRAELSSDFLNFLMNSTKTVGFYRYKVIKHDHTIPDIEVWLESDKPLEFIRNELRKVEDGHVMVQSLALEQDYTGERDYTL